MKLTSVSTRVPAVRTAKRTAMGMDCFTANELGVLPAYISKRVSLLEATLKVRLFHRTTRRVTVTADGQTVFQWAQRILEDYEQMNEAVSSSKLTPRGLLRISTSTGFGRKRVAPALSEFA